jgi:probable O-glycosylation ligase (exosortase A-associated)
MNTIGTYEQDGSAMGRINAWHFAYNLAKDRPLVGGGFGAFTQEAFAVWAPNPNDFHDSHSIWFTMLGEHGFVGLGLFVLLWLLTWRLSSGLIRSCTGRSELLWVADLARMIQVALIGYWVGGSFLGLAYWDMPYLLAGVLVLCRVLVDRHLAVPLPTGATTPVGSGLLHERKNL